MKSKFHTWLNQRMPLEEFFRRQFTEYNLPRNLNFWYYFGSLALVVLIIQLISGIWLTMFYTPTASDAFSSIEYIMREVPFGWLLRYLHTTGASFCFIVIYLHMFRSLLYGSYQNPRELVWLGGVLLYVVLISEAFMGYLLPWGQMSYWAAEVILSLFNAVPWVGDGLANWIRGDYVVSGITLHRFFAFHVAAMPLLIAGLIIFHLSSLRQVGSNNPTGEPVETIPFHPFYTVKDLFGIAVFLVIFLGIVFYLPTFFGLFIEPINSSPANPLQTPAQIHPIWYLAPYYAILRAVPDKLLGILTVNLSLILWFFLPWLDRSSIRSVVFRNRINQIILGLFVISFLGLGVLGSIEVTENRMLMARIFTAGYFLFFLLMPFYSKWMKK